MFYNPQKEEFNMKKFVLNIFMVFAILFTFSMSAWSMYFGPTWGKETISVYVPADSAYSSQMKRAFQRWQSAANNKIKFEFITDEENADVIVNFTAEVDGSDGEVASYQTTVQGGQIIKAQINIATEGDKKFSNDYIYTYMLHEVGHILGLPDSNRNLGIMHSPVNEKQDIITNDIVKLYRFNSWSTMNQKINIVK